MVDLGLTDEQFGDLSYAQFDALIDRKLEIDRRSYLCAGIVAAAVVNMQRDPDSPAVSPLDFIPGEKKKTELLEMDPNEQAAHVMSQFSKREVRRG